MKLINQFQISNTKLELQIVFPIICEILQNYSRGESPIGLTLIIT